MPLAQDSKIALKSIRALLRLFQARKAAHAADCGGLADDQMRPAGVKKSQLFVHLRIKTKIGFPPYHNVASGVFVTEQYPQRLRSRLCHGVMFLPLL